MSTTDHPADQRLARPFGKAWGAAIFGVVIGLAMAAAATARGEFWLGLVMLGVMVLYAVILLAFQGHDVIALLSSENTDERGKLIQHRAGYFALNIVALFCIVQFLVALAQDRDATAWSSTAAVAAVSFVGALIYNARRS